MGLACSHGILPWALEEEDFGNAVGPGGTQSDVLLEGKGRKWGIQYIFRHVFELGQ